MSATSADWSADKNAGDSNAGGGSVPAAGGGSCLLCGWMLCLCPPADDNVAGGINHDFAVLAESELARMQVSMADWLYRIQDGVCSAHTQHLVDQIQTVQYDVASLLSKIEDTHEEVDFEFAQNCWQV